MIYTFGRDEIEKGIDLVEPYALISISTPPKSHMSGRPPHAFDEDTSGASLPSDEFRLDILRLRFDDIDVLPNGIIDQARAQYSLYSGEQAFQVAAYVRAWVGRNLVIHCDAGISRSQGMADAIADHLGIRADHYRAGMPNRRVYRLTWQALRPGDLGGSFAHITPRLPEPPMTVTLPRIQPGGIKDKYRINFR